MFWLLTAWLITVGLSSIIPQIFWPLGEAPSETGACKTGLHDMAEELMSRASQSMADAPEVEEREALRAWLADWDRRLNVLRGTCRPPEQQAWAELLRLRHGMQSLIERFDREEAPRLRKIDALLGSSASPPAQ